MRIARPDGTAWLSCPGTGEVSAWVERFAAFNDEAAGRSGYYSR